MNDNLNLWQSVRTPPKEALKAITAGRLKGKTDINPCWRLMKLTECFGPCGIGWKYTIKSERLEPGADGEVAAFVDIDLYVKMGGEWSEAIPGTGGAMFVSKERSGLYTDDEALKKALTDAISVSCKALGVAADIYWEKDPTKYTDPERAAQNRSQPNPKQTSPSGKVVHICSDCGKQVTEIQGKSGKPITADQLAAMSMKNYGLVLCAECQAKRKAERHE